MSNPLRRWTLIGAAALLVVAVVAFQLGRSSDDPQTKTQVVNPLQNARDRLQRERKAEIDRKAYLPPTSENLIALIEAHGTGRPAPESAASAIAPYDTMPEVPDRDLLGNPTELDPSHWFNVVYCDEGGGVSSWNVNPYTVNAYQSTLTLVEPPCGAGGTSPDAGVDQSGRVDKSQSSGSVEFTDSELCDEELAVKDTSCDEARAVVEQLGPIGGGRIGADGFECVQVAGNEFGGVHECTNGAKILRAKFSE